MIIGYILHNVMCYLFLFPSRPPPPDACDARYPDCMKCNSTECTECSTGFELNETGECGRYCVILADENMYFCTSAECTECTQLSDYFN